MIVKIARKLPLLPTAAVHRQNFTSAKQLLLTNFGGLPNNLENNVSRFLS